MSINSRKIILKCPMFFALRSLPLFWHAFCILYNEMAEKKDFGQILILDTDQKAVHQLNECLTKEGYEVLHVEEPSQMLEKVKNNQADAIILAVETRGIKAYDLIPVIKKMNRCIPIIVTSLDDSIEVAARVREQGVFFYAIKPLDMKEIKLVIRNALSRKFKCIRETSWIDKEELKEKDFEEEILDIEEAGEILKLSKTTLNKLASKGEIPASRIGKNWVFIRNQLFEWLRVTAAGNQRNYGTLILETMDEGVAVVDRQLKIVSCNSAYLQSLDIPRDRIIGEYCYRVSHCSMIPCAEATCPAQQAFKTARSAKLMHVNYDEQGKPHYFDVVALPIRDEHGEVPEVIEIIRDNTEIYDLNRHLNWVIGFVAHELKGTLGSIMMNISALADEKICQTIKENKKNDMLLSSLSSMKLMHDMIRNYLVSSKGNSGQLPFEIATVDIGKDILKPIIEELRPILLKKQMKVEPQIQGERPVFCDRDLMRIVFSNLINNAVKYGTAGTKISCKIIITDQELKVSVFNEGSGIPKEKLTEVFGEFTRFDTSGVGGTGLGLYVVKMIIDMHQGIVKAESGFIIDGESITYEKFYSDEKYYDLRDKEAQLKKFALFVVKIPDQKICPPTLPSPIRHTV